MSDVVAMSESEVLTALNGLKQATKSGDPLGEDGARIHVWYKSFGEASPVAVMEAKRAEELGLPKDRFTGRLSKVWRSKGGDLIVTCFVELERERKWRSFNVAKGSVLKVAVLGA